MSSADTITSGSRPVAPAKTGKVVRPKPFIPKRAPPSQSVYTDGDYDADGNITTLRKVPLGDAYQKRRDTATMATATQADITRPPEMPSVSVGGHAKGVPTRTAATAAPSKDANHPPPSPDLVNKNLYDGLPGKPDYVPPRANKHRLDKNKFDVRTPPGMADHDEQFICVLRTIENRHPDEDRILQHYALQYVARKNGTYNPIEDPPVVLTDLIPTCCVVLDKVFDKNNAMGENKEVSKYVRKIKDYTDFDVVPVYMGRPFQIPLHALTAFKYKDKVMDQIMTEFYANQDQSASDILERVEADREGKVPQKPKWHVYDGINQGAFGPRTKITSTSEDNPPKTKSWGSEDEDEDEDEEDEGWTAVKAKTKGKAKPPIASAQKRGGVRRAAPKGSSNRKNTGDNV